MKKMVREPYVQGTLCPVMTGGVGYKIDFVDKMPRYSKITRVSRTIGKNRVVDELIMRFTHDIEIKSMLPEIQPADKAVVVVMKLEQL